MDPFRDDICFKIADGDISSLSDIEKKKYCGLDNSVYFYNADTKVATCLFCPINCISCSKDGPTLKCNECKAGYTGNDCVFCPSECKKCNPDGTCALCKDGYEYN